MDLSDSVISSHYPAEEAVRTYGGQLHHNFVDLDSLNLEQIPSPLPGVRNVVIKQPIGVV